MLSNVVVLVLSVSKGYPLRSSTSFIRDQTGESLNMDLYVTRRGA